MNRSCMMCGEQYGTSQGEDYRGRKIWLCTTGDCEREFDRDEQDEATQKLWALRKFAWYFHFLISNAG